MVLVPQEVLLLIFKCLPIDDSLNVALLGLQFAFGFSSELLSNQFVASHWKQQCPDVSPQTWKRLPAPYQYHAFVLRLQETRHFSEKRQEICWMYQLRSTAQPVALGELILSDAELKSNPELLATALIWAVFNEYHSLVELFFNQCFEIGNDCLLIAATDRSWAAVQKLLSYRDFVNPSFQDNKVLELSHNFCPILVLIQLSMEL